MFRRKFLATIPSLLGMRSINAETAKPKKSLIVHHVLFWLKDPNSAEDKIKLLEKLRTLKKIEFHRTLIGVPVPAAGSNDIDSSYHVSLVTYFDSEKGRKAYENNHVHQTFIRECSHLWDKKVTYDSVCELP
jgi:hypothetical protein